jgi:hypothetical protein
VSAHSNAIVPEGSPQQCPDFDVNRKSGGSRTSNCETRSCQNSTHRSLEPDAARADRRCHATKSSDDSTLPIAAVRGDAQGCNSDALGVQSESNFGPDGADHGALLLLGAIVVRVTIVSEHSEVRTQSTRENGAGATLDIGLPDLRKSLP